MKRFVPPKLTAVIRNLSVRVDIDKIDLYNCGIGNEEVKLLVKTLEKYNSTVTEMDLSGNRITNDGAGLIACFLKKTTL